MKIALLMLSLASLVCASPSEQLIDALVLVESSGNPRAIGDGGKAYGLLQIHPATVRDVNRITGHKFTHRDAFRPEIARYICRTYLAHYVTRERLKREPTAQDFARVWNGGPDGFRKPQTLAYWRRVSRTLNTITVAKLRTAIIKP